jgi:hypothetical protein
MDLVSREVPAMTEMIQKLEFRQATYDENIIRHVVLVVYTTVSPTRVLKLNSLVTEAHLLFRQIFELRVHCMVCNTSHQPIAIRVDTERRSSSRNSRPAYAYEADRQSLDGTRVFGPPLSSRTRSRGIDQ